MATAVGETAPGGNRAPISPPPDQPARAVIYSLGRHGCAANPMTPFAVGTHVAGLHLDRLVARTATGTVFRAGETASGERRAVKVLDRLDASSMRRFQREAELLAAIDHPLVVRFRGWHEVDGHVMLVTDWIEGESLHEQLRRDGPLSVERARETTTALAAALDHLHDRGVLHRDVSARNVMIDEAGEPTLIDLGIGHQLDADTLTNDDLLAGTPAYLAPEIIRGERATPQADQYSLGVLVHEMLTGDRPFPGGESLATALHHQLETAPTPLDELDGSIPIATGEAVLRSLQKDPARRFDSAGEFARAVAGAAPAAPRFAVISGRARRSRAVAFGAVALISVVAIAGFVWSQSRGGGTAAAARWESGQAALLSCNLLTGNTFENGVMPLDYFGLPADSESIVAGSGFGGSAGLQVGRANRFGQYAEVISITPGESYLFHGWFAPRNDVADAEMGITLLDANYQGLEVSRRSPIGETTGFFSVEMSDLPAGAEFALPYLFKDASSGVVVADELVFGPLTACRSQIDAAS